MSDFMSGLASITKQVQQTLNSYEMRKIGDKVTGYVMNFTDAETKVREATNEDPWGPTGPEMQEIASMTFQYDLFGEVMGMLWKRMLQENKVAWRRVYKSLILLNHLLKNGSERCIASARDHSFEMRSLESYKCIDERGKDEGANVRHRVKQILELLSDEDLLRAERRKAKHEGKEKYQGFSREEMTMGRGGSASTGGFKSSAKSNFDDWRDLPENTRSKRFDDEEDEVGGKARTGRKEVTAFDFHSGDNGSGRHHSGSPELGIRDTKTPDNINDDDEFGDFTEARTHAHAHGRGASSQALASPPPIPPPSSAPTLKSANKIHHPVAQRQRSNDLLGLGLDEPASVLTNVSDAGGWSGSTAPTASKGGTGLDDIFGAPSPPTATSIPCQKGTDLLDGLLIDSASPQQPPLATTTGGGMDFLFGGTTNNQPPATLMNPVPATLAFNQTQPNGSGSHGVGGVQLSKTWDDLKKVNIDFDTLSLRPSPSKGGPSLSELQRGGGGSGKNTSGMPW